MSSGREVSQSATDSSREENTATENRAAVRVSDRVRKAVERLERFQKVTAALLGCLTPTDCADTLVKEGIAATDARAGAVMLLSRAHDHLELVGSVGYPDEMVDRWRSFPLQEPLPHAESVRTGLPLFLESWEQRTARYPHLATGSDPTSDQAWALIPFLLEGRAFGCLALSYPEQQPFAEDERAFLVGLAQQGALALERARLYATVTAQRIFLKDVLSSVTDGRLILCETEAELPPALPLSAAGPILLSDKRHVRMLRLAAQEAAVACGFAAQPTDDLTVAAGEAATNVLIHGGKQGGEGRICVDATAGRVQVWVVDHGYGIDFHRLPKATLQRGYSTAGTLGHGFKMMLSMADHVYLLTGPHGTTVVLEQNRTSPEAAWLSSVQ